MTKGNKAIANMPLNLIHKQIAEMCKVKGAVKPL